MLEGLNRIVHRRVDKTTVQAHPDAARLGMAPFANGRSRPPPRHSAWRRPRVSSLVFV
jgi:hypothetical protein